MFRNEHHINSSYLDAFYLQRNFIIKCRGNLEYKEGEENERKKGR